MPTILIINLVGFLVSIQIHIHKLSFSVLKWQQLLLILVSVLCILNLFYALKSKPSIEEIRKNRKSFFIRFLMYLLVYCYYFYPFLDETLGYLFFSIITVSNLFLSLYTTMIGFNDISSVFVKD